MNTVVLAGTVVDEPTVRAASSGGTVAMFEIEIPYREGISNKQHIAAFGALADNLDIEPGDRVLIKGHLEKSGTVVADDIGISFKVRNPFSEP